jgi:glucose/mannose-6-phosphate isomerase
MDSAGLTNETVRQLENSADWLKEKLDAWSPIVPTMNNQAKKLAQDIIGKSIVIYSSVLFAPLAYKWKINFNENAKSIAWWNQYSEFNHNEFIGWTNQPVDKPYSVIDLRSNLDHPQIQKRYTLSEQMLSGKRPAPEVVNLEGEDLLKQIMWGTGLGDFVSLYYAILSGIDPTPIDLMDQLKEKLK